jgi:hypothetical protein
MRVLAAALLLSSPLLGACALPVPGSGGTTHYVVVGLGVVSVNDTKNAAIATDSHVLGLQVSSAPGIKFGAGYVSGSVVMIPNNARDVRIAVERSPFGGVTIQVDRAELGSDVGQVGSVSR